MQPEKRTGAVRARAKRTRKHLKIALTIPIARAIVGSNLGKPSKMPGYSWGISAHGCRRGSQLAEIPGTVCASCYARRGHYTTPSVKNAHERRQAGFEHPQWVDAMVLLINSYAAYGHFRWFDSGDLQSIDMLDRICQVVERTPTVRHWLPTHEPTIVRAHLRRAGSVPGNLVIRLSADFIEDRPTADHGLPHTSTVHKHKGEPVPAADGQRSSSVECRAYERGNQCGLCRACWDSRVQNISYHKH